MPTFVAKPAASFTPDGYPSETAALRAAYTVAKVVDACTALSLVEHMTTGAAETFKAGQTGAVAAFHASLALQTLSPALIVSASLLSSLGAVLTSGGDLPPVGATVVRNHAGFILGDMVARVVGSWRVAAGETQDSKAEVFAAVVAMTEALGRPELDLCHAAVAEGLGFAVSALHTFVSVGRPASLAAELVDRIQVALRSALAKCRSDATVDTQSKVGSGSSVARLEAVAGHISTSTIQSTIADGETAWTRIALRKLNSQPRQNSLETYLHFACE